MSWFALSLPDNPRGDLQTETETYFDTYFQAREIPTPPKCQVTGVKSRYLLFKYIAIFRRVSNMVINRM